MMEKEKVDHDLEVLYVTASSYPDGILAAHQQLHALVPFSADRRYFGISRPERDTIVYRAAAEVKRKEEAQKYQCETLVLKKGTYVTLPVHNFRQDPRSIEKAFQTLLASPGLDPQGYCVEWYLNDQEAVKCMIRLAESDWK